ncbi:MAG: glycosyl hydrolase [Betaproteobacteria bacterium RIFCSPLOWO2_12_FULL_65_14]|nr:MAG: glycosyl hydrolase [Betaproteobacteria bacterium RIFCSPLOWO2_12_FULL_65_14]
MTKWLIFGFLALAGFAQAQSLTLTHVHGLAWSADGKRLMIPSHHGLAVYENGKWSKAPGPQHDFMGFAATARHLYSSGHPAHGSGFTNPFGLVRSKDGGKTWEKLALEGETDFHLLATGWNTNAIYVWNPEPSSRMRRTGLHCTFDEGRAWKSVRAAGLEGEPHALAVHPNDPKTVAIATSSGIYLSRDSGERFAALARGVQGLSVFFDLNGKDLLYGAYDGRPVLARAALGPAKPRELSLPPLRNDAVAYVAQNPANRAEYAIATFERSVYLSRDAGGSWAMIAERGRAK